MIKKVIKYIDYNGVEREETFYFNISRLEAAEMDTSSRGGYDQVIQKIIESQDKGEMLSIFKEFVLSAYGEKTADGTSFIKNAELRNKFAQSEAFVELFLELGNDSKLAAAFVAGVLPKAPIQKTE